MKKISLIVIISMIFTMFFCAVAFSQNVNLGIDANILSSAQAFSLINDNMLFQQQDDDDNDNDDGGEVNIEVEKIKEDNGYPLWKILPNKYYESPFRRFEIIFFASFSYIFFLNVTLLETITQIDPSDYGRNLVFDRFPLPLFFFAFACSTILALAVAFEDFRFVYIENARPKKEENQENNNSTSNSTNPAKPTVSVYFAPKIFFYDDYIEFRILMINF